jgi:chromosome segregation ATPase
MGLFAFLTASRLRAELTRQRDEIARLHQLLDAEGEQRQESEKLSAQYLRENETIVERGRELEDRMERQDAVCKEEKLMLRKQLDDERAEIRQEADLRVREVEASVSELRQELAQKELQRDQAAAECVGLSERASELQRQGDDVSAQLATCRSRVAELEAENKRLELDMKRIVGNLSRW